MGGQAGACPRPRGASLRRRPLLWGRVTRPPAPSMVRLECLEGTVSAVVLKLQEPSRCLRRSRLPSPYAMRAGPGRGPALLGRGSASLRAWHPGPVEPCWEAGLGRILSRGAEERLAPSLWPGSGRAQGQGWEARPWLRLSGSSPRVCPWPECPVPHGGLRDPGPQSPDCR